MKKVFLGNLFQLSLANACTTILYFAQMNLLYEYFDAGIVYLATISTAYFAQGLGLLAFLLLYRRWPSVFRKRIILIGVMISFLPILFMTLFLKSGVFLMVLLIITNILIGYVLGNCFTNLAAFIDKRHIGKCWGSAYAIGNMLSWLASQFDSTFITSVKIIPIICILIGLTIVPIMMSKDLPKEDHISLKFSGEEKQKYLWIMLVIILMSVIYTLGSTDYSMIAETKATESTFYTRCTYALGLLTAGFLYDKSHKLSAIFALASIMFPIMASILIRIPLYINLIYCLSFYFLAFLSVYRSCVFISLGSENSSLLCLAGLGLLISRFSESIISLINSFLSNSEVWGFIISGVLFVPMIIVFCTMLLKQTAAQQPTEEEKLLQFSESHKLTRREEEILQLLLKGASNGEIAQTLTISDGTTRFHVSNLLKKTECKSRNELVHKFRHE